MSSEAGFYSFEPTLLASDSSIDEQLAIDVNDIDNIARRERIKWAGRARKRRVVINPERSVSKTFLTLLI